MTKRIKDALGRIRESHPAMGAYLAAHLPGALGPLVVEQFPHGHSNLTYLIRMGDQELVLRRPPLGHVLATAHDMKREHRVISEEFAVLDRAGRLQLPKTHVAALGLKDRVRLRLEEDHVGIWPDRDPAVPPVRRPRREPADMPGAPDETDP